MNKTCGTCKYWGNSESKAEYRTCQKVVHDAEYLTGEPFAEKLIESDRLKEYDSKELEKIKSFKESTNVASQDGSGYRAALKCREDFGCVNHEEK